MMLPFWLAVAPCGAQPVARDSLEGIWGVVVNAPLTRGPLTVIDGDSAWTLRFANTVVQARPQGDTVRFALPGIGTLRIRQRRDQPPHAMWIQPPAFGPAFASPVALRATGRARWAGQIEPVEQRFSLYLLIDRDSSGALTARFRNPEANFGGGRTFRLARRDSVIELRDRATGVVRFTQPYDARAGTIGFDFGAPLVARRLAVGEATGAVPRTDGRTLYRYRRPAMRADGWPTADASRFGVTPDSLAALVRTVMAASPYDRSQPEVHAVLLARHGHLLFEEYFHGYDVERLHDLRSASKTITSIMVGAAMARGMPLAATTPVTRAGATVGQLLTHRSGLDCDDDDPDSPGHEDRMQQQSGEPDWYRFAESLPQRAPPGSRYAYCSAAYNLVGRALREATGRWLPEFFDTAIARPLGIRHYGINIMPTGEGYAAGGMQLRARDLLRLGQLYLAHGAWGGSSVVAPVWVASSTQRQQPLAEGPDDGYGWHRHRLLLAGRSVDAYEASGNGGQFLVVVPSLDAVAVVLAGNYGEGRLWWRIRQDIIARYLVAAVRDDGRATAPRRRSHTASPPSR